jgi:hypothetical protein
MTGDMVHPGGLWRITVVNGNGYHTAAESTRRSINMPANLADKIEDIARERHVSRNRVILDLLQDGIAAYDRRRAVFWDLANRFQQSTDRVEAGRLREELLQMTFGA